ncbi:hypothetical protein [Paenibacillus kribbensis]|uniref:hypothetical protein n=1 Tax=Paenibacillus kribbensis TaxID=172713 RepID=UPI0015B91A71|nr:hypothetical protein [Paenibacillus kribbensis]
MLEENQKSKYLKFSNGVSKKLKKLKDSFEEMYKREMSKENNVLRGMYSDENNFDSSIVKDLRRDNLAEEFIYAYCKTGILLSRKDINEVSECVAQEYAMYVEEYRENVYNAEINGEVNILVYVKLINEILEKTYIHIDVLLDSFFKKFIKIHLEGKQKFYNYEIRNKIDFCGFCSLKTIKNLNSISMLMNNDLVENIYVTSRSIFESYLYILTLNTNENFFEEKIKKSGRINISLLADKSNYIEDRELYDLFYRTSSQYVHVDILTARNYFSISNPFTEVDPLFISAVMGLTFAVLLLEQISLLKESEEQFRIDTDDWITIAKAELICCYKILELNHLTRNKVYTILKKRLLAASI